MISLMSVYRHNNEAMLKCYLACIDQNKLLKDVERPDHPEISDCVMDAVRFRAAF
jgi:hypothetical protein